MASRINEATIASLTKAGYEVEDMEAVYGPEWRGQWRWLHSDGSFQDWGTSDSSEEAWQDALDHLECEGED